MNHKRFFRFNIPPMAAPAEEVGIVGNWKRVKPTRGGSTQEEFCSDARRHAQIETGTGTAQSARAPKVRDAQLRTSLELLDRQVIDERLPALRIVD